MLAGVNNHCHVVLCDRLAKRQSRAEKICGSAKTQLEASEVVYPYSLYIHIVSMLKFGLLEQKHFRRAKCSVTDHRRRHFPLCSSCCQILLILVKFYTF